MDLSPLAQYLGGIGLVAVIIVMFFLKFMTNESKRKKEDVEREQERDRKITILETHIETMRSQINHIENKGTDNTDSLYKEINEIKQLLMNLKVDLAERYVTKVNCEKNH